MTYLSHKIRGVKNRLEFLEVSLQNLRCMFLILNLKREHLSKKTECKEGCRSVLLSTPLQSKVKEAFDRHGSDKGRGSGNYLIYSFIDGDTNDGVMLEIGIGSHNPQIPSNMIGIGSSGGSIKAFLELFPQWRIYAADIDPSCFFKAPRLNCEVVNQRKLRSLRKLAQKLPKLNLVVVDGLHKFYADFNSLFVLRSKMLCGGVFVIEDIFDAELDRWKPIIAILSQDFAIAIRKRPGGNALILVKSCAQSRDARQDEIEKLRSA